MRVVGERNTKSLRGLFCRRHSTLHKRQKPQMQSFNCAMTNGPRRCLVRRMASTHKPPQTTISIFFWSTLHPRTMHFPKRPLITVGNTCQISWCTFRANGQQIQHPRQKLNKEINHNTYQVYDIPGP